jgi:hypothetical protein
MLPGPQMLRWLVNDELEIIWKEAIVACFKLQPMCVVTEENRENVIANGLLGSEAWNRGARTRSRGTEQTNAAFSCEVLGFGSGSVVFTFRYVTPYHCVTGARRCEGTCYPRYWIMRFLKMRPRRCLETSETNYNDPVIRCRIPEERIPQLHIPLIIGL